MSPVSRAAALMCTTLTALALSACSDPASPVAEPLETPSALTESPAFARAARPYLPGEQQPAVELDRGSLAIMPNGVGQVLRQTFRPTRTERLGYLEVPVACSPGVLLNVKIRNQAGRVLSEVNVVDLAGSIDGVFDLIQVTDLTASAGVRLIANERYSFELAAFPSPGASGNTCAIARGPAANSYRRGRGFYQDPINGPAFLPLPNGAAGDNEDLPFRTLVR
ncbi:MAG: hypothetical protein IT353_24020 [Gemmatimonadaceae bacterium]|nr:hypothetical protein [Gemmatimonadaceae bacterium]